MAVDPVHNPFDAAYAPWPLRFYVLSGGSIAYFAQPKDCSYSLTALREAVLGVLGDAATEGGGAQHDDGP